MTLTICLWVHSKIRPQLWQATKYCKCINNFHLRNMTFNNFNSFFLPNVYFFLTSTQHSALNIHFQIPGRQLQMASVFVIFSALVHTVSYQLQPWAGVCRHSLPLYRCPWVYSWTSHDAKLQENPLTVLTDLHSTWHIVIIQKTVIRGFCGDTVVKTLPSNTGVMGSIPS